MSIQSSNQQENNSGTCTDTRKLDIDLSRVPMFDPAFQKKSGSHNSHEESRSDSLPTLKATKKTPPSWPHRPFHKRLLGVCDEHREATKGLTHDNINPIWLAEQRGTTTSCSPSREDSELLAIYHDAILQNEEFSDFYIFSDGGIDEIVALISKALGSREWVDGRLGLKTDTLRQLILKKGLFTYNELPQVSVPDLISRVLKLLSGSGNSSETHFTCPDSSERNVVTGNRYKLSVNMKSKLFSLQEINGEHMPQRWNTLTLNKFVLLLALVDSYRNRPQTPLRLGEVKELFERQGENYKKHFPSKIDPQFEKVHIQQLTQSFVENLKKNKIDILVRTNNRPVTIHLAL